MIREALVDLLASVGLDALPFASPRAFLDAPRRAASGRSDRRICMLAKPFNPLELLACVEAAIFAA